MPATHTITEPRRETRAEQPYVAIRRDVTMGEIPTVLPPLHDVLAGWLAARGVRASGPPFFRYLVIDMAGLLSIEVGFPVASPMAGDDGVTSGVLPGGTYVTTIHHGHPVGLEAATGDLLAWAQAEGIVWDKEPQGRGEAWRSRIEWYLDDGGDMADWDTELAFLTR